MRAAKTIYSPRIASTDRRQGLAAEGIPRLNFPPQRPEAKQSIFPRTGLSQQMGANVSRTVPITGVVGPPGPASAAASIAREPAPGHAVRLRAAIMPGK